MTSKPGHRAFVRTLLAAAVLHAWAASTFAGGVVYRAVSLPDLPLFSAQQSVQVLGLNDAGQVVGGAVDFQTGTSQAFLYGNGQMLAVGGPRAAGFSSFASAISNPVGSRGNVNVVGNFTSNSNVDDRLGFIQSYSGLLGQLGTAQRFDVPGGVRVSALGVNQAGQVVGSVLGSGGAPNTTLPDGIQRAYVRSAAGEVTILRTPLSLRAQAVAINQSGLVAGTYLQNIGFKQRAAVWEGGVVRDLGTLGGGEARANALNDAGTVVGESQVADTLEFLHAFKFRNGTMTRLAGNLDNGQFSSAESINAQEQTLGWFSPGGGGVKRLFLHSDSGGAVDLNPYILGLSGSERFTGAIALNASGQIIANSSERGGVLMSPEGTLSWSSLRGGRAGDASHWDSGLGFVPSRFFDVVIDGRAAQTVLADASFAAKTLQLGGALRGVTTLQLSGGAVVQALGGLTILSNGQLQGAGRISGPMVVNHGQVRALPGQLLQLDGGLDNRGLVTGTGRIETNLINRGGAGAGVQVGAGQNLTLAGTVHSAADGSHIRIQDGGTLAFQGRFVNQAGAFIDIHRGTLQVGYGTQRMDNGGQIVVASGRAELLGDVNNGPRGLIHARDAADLTVWNSLRNDGELRVSGGSRIVYAGAVSGVGSFTGGDGLHRFEGGYAPGNSPAAVQMGNVQFASLVTMELGGLAPGTQHDRINFSGSVFFEAASFLRVVLIGGFVPQAGNSFALFSYAQSPVGNFEDFYLPTLAAGLSWDVSRIHSTGVLGVAAVPEPAAAALWLLGAAGLLSFRRFGRSRTATCAL